jgi:hypothetical protein
MRTSPLPEVVAVPVVEVLPSPRQKSPVEKTVV